MNAESLLQSGDLTACKVQLFNQIKKDPGNVQLRVFLFQFSCINRDWQRSKTQLDVLKYMTDLTLANSNSYSKTIVVNY